MKTALMIYAVALMSGCATMSAKPGEFNLSGITGDPVRATAVAGTVTTNQYQAETERVVKLEMIKRGMHPGYGQGYGGYGGYGTYGSNLYFRGLVPYVQQPAAMPRAYTAPGVQANAVPQGQYATQKDLAKVEEKADDGLCLHWKQKQENKNKPLNQCPLKK